MVENVTNHLDFEREEDDKETIEEDPYIIS